MNNTIIQRLTVIEELLKTQSSKPFTFQNAKTYLGVSSSFLYKLTCSGQIRHYKPSGKLIFFEKKDLDNWLLKNPIKSIYEINQEATAHVFLKSMGNNLSARNSKHSKDNVI